MPTIEIASIQAAGIELKQSDFEISILKENKMNSHRGLFDVVLRKEEGVIFHLGSPELKDDKKGGYFAGELIDWKFEVSDVEVNENGAIDSRNEYQHYKFRFLNKFQVEIDKLLKIALDNSPIKKVFFLTDYQFGPYEPTIEVIHTISKFWRHHDHGGLRFNTFYEMNG